MVVAAVELVELPAVAGLEGDGHPARLDVLELLRVGHGMDDEADVGADIESEPVGKRRQHARRCLGPPFGDAAPAFVPDPATVELRRGSAQTAAALAAAAR